MSPSSQARASGALSEPLLDQAEAGRRNGSGADEGADSASAVTQQGGQAGRVLLNLLNSGIGSSTVAMPMAVRTLGVATAMAAMLVQATLGIAANHILSREADREGSGSYHDLMHARFGKWGGRAVALAQMLNSLGKCVVWLIILADLVVGSAGSGLLPELLRAAGRGDLAEGDAWWLRRWPWIALLAALATPVVSVRSLDKLSGVSLIGDAAVALMAVSACVLTGVALRQGKAAHIHWLPSAEEVGARSRGLFALEIASVLPVLMGAAFTQNNIHTMMHQLHPYSQSLLDAVQASARAITIAAFLTIGVANYAVFGGDLEPDVLLNYRAAGLRGLLPGGPALVLATAVKLSFLVNGLLTLPMYLFPGKRGRWAQSNLWAALPSQSAEQRMGRTSSFAATNIASLAACALVAMLVPSIWKPLKLLGGTAVSCLAFVFPGAIALSMYSARGGGGPSGRGNWDRALWALGWVLVAVGWVQLAASVASQFT